MTALIILLFFALAAGVLFLYLLLHPRTPAPALPASLPQTFTIESFLDLNARRFAQVKQALSKQDYQYLRRRGQDDLARRLRRERLAVLRGYVGALKSDFKNLLHLHKVLGALEAEVVRQHEPQMIVLGLQFRLLYALVQAKLALARLTLTTVNVEPLVALVNRTAQTMEATLNSLAEAQARQLRAELS